MIIRAIKTKQLDFLYHVFASNKNFQWLGDNDDADSNPDSDDLNYGQEMHLIFTYDWLFKNIKKYKPNECDELIRQVADWNLMSNENILKSLLINGHDMIAADFGYVYRKQHAHIDLLKFALNNENELFLKFALKFDVFESGLLETKDMIDTIMKTLIDGTKTELILNVCIYSDFSAWKRPDIDRFMEFLNCTIDPDKEQNLMYKCYNPILVICLSCIFLE